MAPELPEFKEPLDNSLRSIVCILDGPVWSLKLDHSSETLLARDI